MKLILLSVFCFSAMAMQAQTQLAPDQNPNYLISQNKYMQAKDSLQGNMNATIQQTYKAYDWYEAKLERKQNRIQNRNERRLYNNYQDYNYYNSGFNNYGYNNYYGNYRYGNRNGYNNFWSLRPSIGYRTGNWWFWF